MPDTLKITLAQHNQSVGDIAGNAAGILAARERARESDLIVFPELHLIGYPPEDLVLKPSLIERAAAELERLAQATARRGPAMLVGSAFVLDGALHNGVALLDHGKVAAVRLKHELPNYGTFDELRLFHAGPLPEPVVVRGTMVGVPISEDIWRPEVSRHLADFGAEILVCINGSPYEINKEALRIAGVAKRRAVDTGLPLAYLNRVGGQDELVFDGASFVVNGDGSLPVQLRDWEEQEVETRWTKTVPGWRCDRGELQPLASHPEDIYCAMVLALRDRIERSGLAGVALALDGGLDSAVGAAIAVDALGPDRVWTALIPARGADPADGARAEALSHALGCRYREIPIVTALDGGERMLAEAGLSSGPDHFTGHGPDQGLAMRLRSTVLLALAERHGAMPLATSNKTVLGLGGALPGDMAGRFNPLRDAYASTVLDLARWRNRERPRIGLGPQGPLIPESLLETGAIAGGGNGLPPLAELDAILKGLIEHDKSVEQLATDGYARDTVRHIEDLLHRGEALRRQAAPGVKLTALNFGRDRRYPMTHAYRSG